MKVLQRLLVGLFLYATVVASSRDNSRSPPSEKASTKGSLTSLEGYPGVLSREAVHDAVEQEIRDNVFSMLEESRIHTNATKITAARKRELWSGDDNDIDNLNDIISTFVIFITPNTLRGNVLGVTAELDLAGECGAITIDYLNLDYKKSGSSLTYEIEALGIDIKCQFIVKWDLGVLDVGDELKVRFALKDNNFEVGVTLKGSPPSSATFNGCDVEINLVGISTQGGFSSDIINELSDLIIELVNNEAEVIADLLCELLTDFTSTVDGVLEALGNTLAPYLSKVQPVDPLQLEKRVQTDIELLDFTDSDLGFIIQVLIDNLQGNVGAFQINTLIELNLLNDDGGFVIVVGDVGGRRQLQEEETTETCPILRRNLKEKEEKEEQQGAFEGMTRKLKETLEIELEEVLKPVLPETVERELQVAGIRNQENLFRFNKLENLQIEIVGLNTFQETQYLEIIGKQTFRTVLELKGLGVRATFILDASINEQPIREEIEVTLHITDIFVTISYFIGLNKEKVEELTIGRLLDNNFANALPCLLSTLEVAGISELDLVVGEVEAPHVKGLIDTGVDNIVNTAIEAAFCTYQDLILIAIPNIAANNATVIVNDYLECYIRTSAGDQSECPEGSDSILIATGIYDPDGNGGGSAGGDPGGLFGVAEGAPGGDMTFDLSQTLGESTFGGMTFSFGGGEVTEFDTGGADASGNLGTSSEGIAGGVMVPGTGRVSSGSNTNSFTEKAGSFVASDPSLLQSAAVSAGPDGRIYGFIDFRDLLLSPEESQRLGGSGQQPYGNLISMAFGMVREALMSVDNSTGLPYINSNLLQPLTVAQSGVAGLLHFQDQLFNASFDTSTIQYLESLLQRIDVTISDARIENLNTVVSPFSFFQPTTQAHVLENILNFGPVAERPLNMSVRLSFDLEGIDSPIAMSNNISINAMAEELDVFTMIRILIPIRGFLNFPISDILNMYCWLALLQSDVLDLDGGDKIKNALGIREFLMKIVNMSVKVQCLNCTSQSIPEVIGIFEQVGATELLGNRVGLLLEDVLRSDFAPSFLTEVLRLGEEAARLCPHSPLYNTTSSRLEDPAIILPALTRRSVDTIVFATVLGAEMAAAVVSESVVQNGMQASKEEDGRTTESHTTASGEGNLLDWTRLNETFIPFAGEVLKMATDYLGPQADGSGDLGVNQVLGGFLGDDGSWNLEFDTMNFEFAGVVFSLHRVGVAGLDSFKQFDVFEPISTHTLQNSLKLDTLSFAVDFSIDITSNFDPPQKYTVSAELQNVTSVVHISTSIDLDKLEALDFGSMLWIENILPCFLSTSSDISIPTLQLTIGNISNPSIQGLQYETNRVVSDTIELVFNRHGHNIIDAVNIAVDRTLRPVLNSYLSSFVSNSSCPGGYSNSTTQVSSEILDFRDLLLPPESAKSLGGSGTQPYGDLFPMLFSLLQDNVLKGASDGLLEANSVFIDPLTKSQSGEEGLLQFKDELFAVAMSFMPSDALTWLKEQFALSIFDARIDNINTLVGPLSMLQPSHLAHVLENMINLGPVPDRSLNATIGFSVGLNGSLPLLNMQNQFDFSAAVGEIDIFADLGFMLSRDRLFRFPLRDVLDMNCWLSLIGMPSTDDSLKGLEIKTLLINLMSMSLDLQCYECTNAILPDLVKILDRSGVSQVLGNRLGPILQEFATSALLPSLMEDFITLGDEAAKLCPHDPLFGQEQMNSSSVDPSNLLPPLSALTLDTLLFIAVIATESMAVVVADSHNQPIPKESQAIQNKNSLSIPEGANLIDWTDLEGTGIPFLPQLIGFVHNSVGGDGDQDPAINALLSGVIGKEGVLELPLGGFSFEEFGVQLTFHHLMVQGLTSFSKFEVLNPTAPQTISNEVGMDELTIGLNISIDVLETDDPPKHVNFSMKFEDIHVSLPVYVAIDGDKLGSITIGSLLHSSNIMPCLLSVAYGFRVQEMVVSVGSIVGPVIEGFLPDSGSSISSSVEAILDRFGETLTGSFPHLFNQTAKSILNGFLSNIETSECQLFPTENMSTYVDFREAFVYDQSNPSPYGDFIPLVKGLLEEELLSVNPETQMPKINDKLIAPLTKAQSGIDGALTMKDDLLSYSFGGLKQIGLDEVAFKLFGAKAENLNTIGAPFKILEPNITSGVLLDNRANFGTEMSPLRFSIRSNLSLVGNLTNSHDEIELYGELLGAPFFAILLARIGSQELLTFPLRYVTSFHCWLATLATPTLQAIGRGETEVESALAIHYIEVLFSTLRVGATCFNCTNPGLAAIPTLLEILEVSGAKDVLGQRTLQFVMDILESDFTQVWLLRFLQDSVRNCPRTKDMQENSIVLANAPFPEVTIEWLETAAFALYVVVQSGAVFFAETISALAIDVKPIFQDPEPNYPPETRLVNFTAMDDYQVGGLVKYAISGANSYLGGESTDPDTGETTLGINQLLGENPILPLDSYSMEFADLEFHFTTFIASMKSMTITGLDTFTKFRILDIVGANHLMNELGWKLLHIELSLELEVKQEEGSLQEGEKLAFTLELEATDISMALELMVGLDYELVRNLQLGALLRIAHILPCMQSTIRHLEISDVDMDIGNIGMKVSGFKSRGTKEAAESFERLLFEEFDNSLAEAAPSLFSMAVKPLLNTAINTYLRESDFKCNEFDFHEDNAGFIDFRDLFLSPNQARRFGGSGEAPYGDLLKTAYGILQLQLLSVHPENGMQVLNPLIGTVSVPGVLLNQGMKFHFRSINADISFKISDLIINNLDSIGRPLSILAPIKKEAHKLNNTGTFGIGERPVSVGANFYMHVKGLTVEDIVNDFDLSLDIHYATVVLTALLKVSELAFVRFPLRDILNIHCWLALIPPPALDSFGFREQGSEPTAALTALDITASRMGLNLDCHNCTSPALLEFGELMKLQESQEEMTALVNEVLDAIASKLGGAFLQDQINRILADAPRNCGHTDQYDPEGKPKAYEMFKAEVEETVPTYVPMLFTIFLPFVIAGFVAVLVKQLVLRRHKKWLKVLPSEQVFLIQQKQEKKDREEDAINEISSSMYRSKEIPFVLRQLVPVIVVANIGFFLSGHLNKGGRILVEFVVAGETFIIDDFFIFSIGQSTVDMWNAGGKELALLILLFSGVWPYTKQLITLALWFLPPGVVSCARRGSFLLWLDLLAKWSMIDIFVMLITVAGFRVSVQSPKLPFLPDNLYSIDLFVVPMWGLYANMIAQLISQISSHFIVHYHRRIIERAKEEYERRLRLQSDSSPTQDSAAASSAIVPSATEEEPRARLCHHSFARQHRVASEKITVRRFVNSIMLVGGVMVCVLLVISCDIASMKLESFGLAALAIELGQDLKQAVRYESVFSMAGLLIEQAKFLGGIRNWIGLSTVSSLFVLTVLLVPITLVLTLLYTWFAPLTAKRRHRVAVFVEILHAWQYIEVYILAIVVESWQLGSISKLLLNRYCRTLEFTLNLLVYYGILDPGDAQCFELEASIMAGAYLFVPLICCLGLLNSFVMKAYIQQLREKQEEEYVATEDEKLRAFDRTTWDSRKEAIRNIKNPEVSFTDNFRWLLRRDPRARSSDLWRKKSFLTQPQASLDLAETMQLAKTSCSDEEHGGEASSTVDSLKSETAESTTEDLESLKSVIENENVERQNPTKMQSATDQVEAAAAEDLQSEQVEPSTEESSEQNEESAEEIKCLLSEQVKTSAHNIEPPHPEQVETSAEELLSSQQPVQIEEADAEFSAFSGARQAEKSLEDLKCLQSEQVESSAQCLENLQPALEASRDDSELFAETTSEGLEFSQSVDAEASTKELEHQSNRVTEADVDC